MQPSSVVALSTYLDTAYMPDREFIDGRIVERTLENPLHARTLALLARALGAQEQQWGTLNLIRPRVQVSETRIRVPDIAVVRPSQQPGVLTEPPLLIAEILSPEDTVMDFLARVIEYTRFGVPGIWIVDPEAKTAWVCVDGTLTRESLLKAPGTPICVDLADLFELYVSPVDWTGCDEVERVPGKLSGRPALKNTRMFADMVLDNFDAGLSATEIAEVYQLRPEQVQIVLDYATRIRASQSEIG